MENSAQDEKNGKIGENSTVEEKNGNVEENPAKKRTAERQLRRDEDADDDVQEEDSGSFQKADQSVISQRKKVKGKRTLSTPTFNFTPSAPTPATTQETKTEEKKVEEKKEDEKKEPEAGSAPKNPFANLTLSPGSLNFGANKFTTSFTFSQTVSPPTFSIPIPSFKPPEGFNFTSPPASIFGENIAKPSGTAEEEKGAEEHVEVPIIPTGKPIIDFPKEPVQSGEENEEHTYQQRVKLFILETGTKEWKERGVGNLRVNVAKDKSFARLIMRTEGSLRLVLNLKLFPTIKVEKAGDKAAKFIGLHLDKPSELCTYLVRAGKAEHIDQLIFAVEKNKNVGQKTEDSKEVN